MLTKTIENIQNSNFLSGIEDALDYIYPENSMHHAGWQSYQRYKELGSYESRLLVVENILQNFGVVWFYLENS